MKNIVYYKKTNKKEEKLPIFEGLTINTMPKLVQAGYRPLSVYEIAKQRVNAWNSLDKNLISMWDVKYFDSGDSIVYHPFGKIKIIYDSKNLRKINKNSKLTDLGSLILPENSFTFLKGEEFSKQQVEMYSKPAFTLNEVIKNPIWQSIFRHDTELLREYANEVFYRSNKQRTMGINLLEKAPKVEVENLICIGGINYDLYDDDLHSSNLYADKDGSVNNDGGRIIGINDKNKLSKNIKNNLEKNLYNF